MKMKAIVFFLLDFRFEYSPVADPSGLPYHSYHWNWRGPQIVIYFFLLFCIQLVSIPGDF